MPGIMQQTRKVLALNWDRSCNSWMAAFEMNTQQERSWRGLAVRPCLAVLRDAAVWLQTRASVWGVRSSLCVFPEGMAPSLPCFI